MFLVIPLVEFLHVLGVDINVHHENPATFLCHVSVSSVKRSRHRFAASRWHPVLTPGAQERHETPTGEPSYHTAPHETSWGGNAHGLFPSPPRAEPAGARAPAQAVSGLARTANAGRAGVHG